MPWNDQAGGSGDKKGGPWGEGPRQPWGQPPRRQRGGPDGADLEEMLRALRERMRGAFGGGGDGRRRRLPTLWILGSLVGAGWLLSGVYVVDAGERAVITQFGEYIETRGPGLHYHIPAPVQARRVVNFTREERMPVQAGEQSGDGDGLMITGDRNVVDIGFVVQWRRSNARDFVFNVRDPEETLRAIAESAMREVVGQRQLQAIITTDRAAVEQSVEVLMQNTLDSYRTGIQVQNVQLQRAVAPQQVIDAFDDVVRAGSDRQTEINGAERYRNEIVPQARGEAQQQIQQAEAYREQAVREANGEAARFNSLYEQYRRAPRVTRERLYLETMERVYRGAEKIIIDRGSGVQPYLPLEQLRRPQQEQQPAAPTQRPSGR
jgi:membrane protease subunit HflK